MPLDIQDLTRWLTASHLHIPSGSLTYLQAVFEVQGPYSRRTLQTLQQEVPNFKDFVSYLQNTLDSLHEKKEQQSSSIVVQNSIGFFIDSKRVSPQDLLQLLDDIFGKKIEQSAIIIKYGMKEQYLKELDQYIQLVTSFVGGSDNPQRQEKIAFLKQIISRMSYSRISCETKKDLKIGSVQEFKESCQLQKVPLRLKEITVDYFFQTMQCLGVQHELSQKFIREGTYPGYNQLLTQIARSIIPSTSKDSISFAQPKKETSRDQTPEGQESMRLIRVVSNPSYETQNSKAIANEETSKQLREISQNSLWGNIFLPKSSYGANNKSFWDMLQEMNRQKTLNQNFMQEQQELMRKGSFKSLISGDAEICLQKKDSGSLIAQTEVVIKMKAEIDPEDKHYMLNPFDIVRAHKDIHEKVRIVLIFSSIDQIGSIKLKKITSEKDQQLVTFPRIDTSYYKKYKDIYISYVTFEIQKGPFHKYELLMYPNKILQKLKMKELKMEIKLEEAHTFNGHHLIIGTHDKFGSNQNRQLLSKAVHFGLFMGIRFIIKTLIFDLKYPEEVIYYYLKFFYDNYTRYQDENLLQQIIKQLQLSKNVGVQQSKYSIYLFYSIFKGNAVRYYLNYQFYKKLRFQKCYLFKTPPEEYSPLIFLEEFYNLTQIIDILIYNQKEAPLVGAMLSLSIKNQRPENIYLLIYLISCLAQPNILKVLQPQLRQEFARNPFLTAIEYFNVKIIPLLNYMTKESNPASKYKALMHFIQELISISKKKKANQKRKIQHLGRHQTLRILSAFPQKNNSKHWITFVSNLKTLYQASNKTIDLIVNLETTAFYLYDDKNLTIDYLKVLLRAPVTRFDKMELNKIFNTISFGQNDVKMLVNALLRSNLQPYSLQELFILLEYFLKYRKLRIQDIQIMLYFLDFYAVNLPKQDQKKIDLVGQVFQRYLFKSNPSSQGLQERHYVSYLKRMKYQLFRAMILGKLISQKLFRAESVDAIIMEISPENENERKDLQKIYAIYIQKKMQSKLEKMKQRPLSLPPQKPQQVL